MNPVLRVENLQASFATRRGVARAVNSLSYELATGETLAIVGESGSGKTVSVLAMLGLLPRRSATIDGHAWFDGVDLVGADETTRRAIVGNRVTMVFQDPMTSLNPVRTIGFQLAEPLRVHLGLSRRDAHQRAGELLDLVGIASPIERLSNYPHQMSGGMRQRAMIAMAVATSPSVLIADEATTALDVTTQAQIVELLQRLQAEMGMAVVWITHDLGVVAGFADRVIVMYAGRAVETASRDQLFAEPRHPYTLGLLGSIPRHGSRRSGRLPAIPGLPPDPLALPPGCAFQDRCGRRIEACTTGQPPVLVGAAGHAAACHVPLPAVAR